MLKLTSWFIDRTVFFSRFVKKHEVNIISKVKLWKIWLSKIYFFFQFHPSSSPPRSTYCIPAGPCCTHSVFETEHSFFSPFVIESSHHCASRSLALILDIFSLKGHGWSSNLRKWYWSWSSLLTLAAGIPTILKFKAIQLYIL